MKIISLTLFLSLYFINSFSQEIAKPYPDTIRIRIKNQVEHEAVKFKKELNMDYLTIEAIKYSVDTFKLSLTSDKRQEYDYSTQGMNNAVLEMAEGYSRLMGRYYLRLLKLLQPQDKHILVEAQNSWLVFKKKEEKLIWLMAEKKYNSGGTIQSNIAVGNYYELIKDRTDQIFSYYNSIIEKMN